MEMFKKTMPAPGSRPGTLVSPPTAIPTLLQRIVYDAEQFEEQVIEEPSEAPPRKDRIVWLNMVGLRDTKKVRSLGKVYGIHNLALEDIVHVPQRPKFELFPNDRALSIIRMVSLGDDGYESEQVSIFWGESEGGGFVLTIQERPGDVFEPIRERIRKGLPIRKKRADYLAYSLIDTLVDEYYAVLEYLGDRLEVLEEEILGEPREHHLQEIHKLKRYLMELRRSLWPTREALQELIRSDTPIIEEETRLHLRDCQDHCTQLVEVVESYRDMAASLADLYLSSVSHRMNEVMKTLTLIATVFIPLSFLAGIFGMNFEYMPELKWRYSYPLFWVLVVSCVAAMVNYFRRRGWLGSSGAGSR